MFRFVRSRFLSTETRAKIQDLLKSRPLVVFMKGTPEEPMCGFSRVVCQILTLQGVEKFTAVNVLENEELRQGIKEYSEWPTIPQVFLKGELIGGSDIMINLHQSGELEKKLLEEKLVVGKE